MNFSLPIYVEERRDPDTPDLATLYVRGGELAIEVQSWSYAVRPPDMVASADLSDPLGILERVAAVVERVRRSAQRLAPTGRVAPDRLTAGQGRYFALLEQCQRVLDQTADLRERLSRQIPGIIPQASGRGRDRPKKHLKRTGKRGYSEVRTDRFARAAAQFDEALQDLDPGTDAPPDVDLSRLVAQTALLSVSRTDRCRERR